MTLRDQLHAVYIDHGALTPELVIETAKPKSHPLHDRFEWDDKIAGPLYRLQQASALIRTVRITYTEDDSEPRSVRGFVATRAEDSSPTYRPMEEVMADPLSRAILLREAKREWATFKRKYEHLQEFASIIGISEAVAV